MDARNKSGHDDGRGGTVAVALSASYLDHLSGVLNMRADVVALAADIEQSVALLRRRL